MYVQPDTIEESKGKKISLEKQWICTSLSERYERKQEVSGSVLFPACLWLLNNEEFSGIFTRERKYVSFIKLRLSRRTCGNVIMVGISYDAHIISIINMLHEQYINIIT